jgi:hypothetical protein
MSLGDGTIITWVSPKNPIKLSDLRLALKRSNFDEELAKDMAPRNAFSRAARELSKERIIKKVEEGDPEIKFQFTREFLSGGSFDYEKEYDVFLHKETGAVTCVDTHMQQTAQQLVDNHKITRMPADITRLIQKIFESSGSDLVPIRQQGGCYFVPPNHTGLIANIRSLLHEVGGELREWDISANSPTTQATIESNMFEHMLGLVDDFNKSCEALSEDTSTKTIERRVERVAELRSKLISYAPLLRGLTAEVEMAIDQAQLNLIGAVSGDQSLPSPPVSVDTGELVA